MIIGTLLFVSLAMTDGISLNIRCGERPGDIYLSLQNIQDADTTVLLGIALANGRWYVPRELVVELKRRGSGEFEDLAYRTPSALAGRLDHWIAPLPVGATFTLRLRANEFVSTTSTNTSGPPEELRVRLTGRAIAGDLSNDMGGLKTWRLWTGQALSNTLRLVDCVPQ